MRKQMKTEIRIRDVTENSPGGILKYYRPFSLAAAVIFLVVGLLFLIIPGGVLMFFNRISRAWGMRPAVVEVPGLYLALAVGYMYLVAFLALLMYRQPAQWIFPFLLAQAKAASSLLSAVLFVLREPVLILLINFVLDALIAVAAFVFYGKIKSLNP
jgi:hypothetical protein